MGGAASLKGDKGKIRSPGEGVLVVPDIMDSVSEKAATSESARLCCPEL